MKTTVSAKLNSSSRSMGIAARSVMGLKALAFLLVILIIAGSLSGCGTFDKPDSGEPLGEGELKPVSGEDFLLDTVCQITVYDIAGSKAGELDEDPDKDEPADAQVSSDFEERANDVIRSAFDECRKYEKLFSKSIKSSDVYRINHAKGNPVKVDKDTVNVIKKGIEYGELSDGRFDITIGRVMDLWEFHDGEKGYGIPPSKDEIKKALKTVDYRKIRIKGDKVELLDPGARLDLGGVAKGWISAKMASHMKKSGVKSAVISLGGNVVCIGGKDEYSDFRIGIRKPFSKESEIADTVTARDKAVITSGIYERYYTHNGKRYHHIIDPKTGYPADTGKIASVTIVSDTEKAADADAMDTVVLLAAGTKDDAAYNKDPASKLLEKFKKLAGEYKLIIIYENGKKKTIS